MIDVADDDTFRAALEALPVPEPGPDFWDDLYAALRHESTVDDARSGVRQGDGWERPTVVPVRPIARRPRSTFRVLAVAAAVMVLVALGALALRAATGSGGPLRSEPISEQTTIPGQQTTIPGQGSTIEGDETGIDRDPVEGSPVAEDPTEGDTPGETSNDALVERGEIVFDAGDSATVTGAIDGEVVDRWTFEAEVGQSIEIDLAIENGVDAFESFTLWEPNSLTLFSTDIGPGDEQLFVAPASGSYTVNVGRFRAGLRPEGSFDYSLQVTLGPLDEALVQEFGTARFTVDGGVDEVLVTTECEHTAERFTATMEAVGGELIDIDISADAAVLQVTGGREANGSIIGQPVGPIYEFNGRFTDGPGQLGGLAYDLVIFGCRR